MLVRRRGDHRLLGRLGGFGGRRLQLGRIHSLFQRGKGSLQVLLARAVGDGRLGVGNSLADGGCAGGRVLAQVHFPDLLQKLVQFGGVAGLLQRCYSRLQRPCSRIHSFLRGVRVAGDRPCGLQRLSDPLPGIRRIKGLVQCLHIRDGVVEFGHVCTEHQRLVGSLQVGASGLDRLVGGVTVGGDLLGLCQRPGKGSPGVGLILAFIQFLDAANGRDQVRVVSALRKTIHGGLQRGGRGGHSLLVCILSGRGGLRLIQRGRKGGPAGGRVLVFHQGGSLFDQLVQHGLVHNGFDGLGRSVQFGLVDADAGVPTGGIGTADIQLEDPSGRITQIIGGNIGRVIGGLGEFFPVRSICQHSVPFLGPHGQQVVYINLFFVQHKELVIGRVHAAAGGRRVFRHADMGDNQLPDVALFADVKGDPQVAAVLTPFSGIRVFLVAVEQLFRALIRVRKCAVGSNNSRTPGYQLQLLAGFNNGHSSCSRLRRVLVRGCHNRQLLCGLVLRNGQQAGLVDHRCLGSGTVYAPGHRMVGDVFTVHLGGKLPGCALLHRHGGRRYGNRGNNRIRGIALQGNVHIVGLAFGHDQALHDRIADRVALGHRFTLEGVSAQNDLGRLAGGHGADLFVAVIVDAIGNAGQLLALGIGRHQVQESGRLRERGGLHSKLVRDQLTGALHLQSEFAAGTGHPDAVDGHRVLALRHRERSLDVIVGGRAGQRLSLVNIDHVARVQAVHRQRDEDVAAVGGAAGIGLRIRFKLDVICRHRRGLFCVFRLKAGAQLDAFPRFCRGGGVVDAAGFRRAKVKAGDGDGAVFCHRLADHGILAAGPCVDLDSLAHRHLLQRKGIIGAGAVLCGGKLDGHRLCLGEGGRLKHLPFVDADAAPGGIAVVIDAQTPFLSGHRFVQQDIGHSGGVVLDALGFLPLALCGLVLQGKVHGVHQHVLAAVLGMLHAPAADRHFAPNVNVHVTGGLVAGAPLGAVQRGAVDGLGSRLALVLGGNAGHFRAQADVLELLLLVNVGIVVAVQPVDHQLGALAADAVGVDGDDLQRDILLVKVTDQGGQVEGRVGGLHDQAGGAVRLDLVDLVGSGAVHSVPVDAGFRIVGVVVQDLVQRHRSGAGQGCAVLVQNGQLPQVDLVVGHSGVAFHLQADGVQGLAGMVGNVHRGGGPGIGLAGRQIVSDRLAVLVAGGALVAVVGHQPGFAVVVLGGQAQFHAVGHRHIGAVKHDVVGGVGVQIPQERDGGAAVVGVGEVIAAAQLGTFGVDDPGPGGHNVLHGLVAPLSVAGQLAVHIVAGAVAGVEVGHKGGAQDGGLVRKEAGHALPGGGGNVRDLGPRVGSGVDVEVLLHLVELCAVRRIAQRGVGAVQRDGQFQFAVLIHQQLIAERGVHAVLLHVQARESIVGAAADGVHGVDRSGDLRVVPVVVHEELVDAHRAVVAALHPALVLAVDGILIRNIAGGQHRVVPADQDVRAFGTHVADHLVQAGRDFRAAAIGFLVEEVPVEAVVLHHLQQLVSHGEAAVRRLLAEGIDFLHIACARAPGEAQRGDDRHAVGVGGVSKFTGGAADQAFLGTGPVHERIGVLPVVEGPAHEVFVPLCAGGVVGRVGQGAEHQFGFRVCLRVYNKAALAVRQRDARPAVPRVRVGFRRPLQKGGHAEGRADRHQGLVCGIRFVHLRRPVLTGGRGTCRQRGTGQYHGQCQQTRAEAFPSSCFHW